MRVPDMKSDPRTMPIAVRCFVSPQPTRQKGGNKKHGSDRHESEWSLTFDTETLTDASQALRIGCFQLRRFGKLVDCGVFYSELISGTDLQVLRNYCEERKLELLPVAEFIEQYIMQISYDWRGSIIGFNLPFDLSRLAIGHQPARGRTMKGGYSLQLSPKPWWPRIQVKHLSARAALMQFTVPARQVNNKRERKERQNRPIKRGAFVDVKSLAAALLSRSFSLKTLADHLETPTRKLSTEGHGQALTPDYLDYAMADVQTTWECYDALTHRLASYGIPEARPGRILTEASLGKAHLQAIGIKPHRVTQPDFPDLLNGTILSGYYGGRAEIHGRRIIKEVAYCDFLSMYPTVCTLMGLWRFVIADGVRWKDTTEQTRSFLSSIDLCALRDKATWSQLATLVRIRPQKNLVPVRAKYDGCSTTIGLNFLTSEDGLWYTLADVIACKMLTGETPEILQAITFEAGPPQEGLQTIEIAGNPEYRINPYEHDFFRRLIDLRTGIKAQAKRANGHERDQLDADQLGIKILANATSYGIYLELIVQDLDAHEVRQGFSTSGKDMSLRTKKVEQPGRYFHPLLGTLITGAARLMLALAERKVRDAGLDWVLCDTDSIAIARPEALPVEEFHRRVDEVRGWFEPLNPYEKPGSILKLEDVNFDADGQVRVPLYALCTSAKRYVLFNLDGQGRPVIRKASAHGLGHLLPPYGEADAPANIPEPNRPLAEIGVQRWQYDLWYRIIEAHLAGHPDEVELDYHPALRNPAASRYGATTPEILRWFKKHNVERPYQDQVKPFNFLIAFQAKRNIGRSEIGPRRRGRPKKARSIFPVAPFDGDVAAAARRAFDRETGVQIPLDQLMTYQEALAWHHLSPESKFLNGEPFDHGWTERRHVIAEKLEFIGKESNRWEEAMTLGLPPDEVSYELVVTKSAVAED